VPIQVGAAIGSGVRAGASAVRGGVAAVRKGGRAGGSAARGGAKAGADATGRAASAGARAGASATGRAASATKGGRPTTPTRAGASAPTRPRRGAPGRGPAGRRSGPTRGWAYQGRVPSTRPAPGGRPEDGEDTNQVSSLVDPLSAAGGRRRVPLTRRRLRKRRRRRRRFALASAVLCCLLLAPLVALSGGVDDDVGTNELAQAAFQDIPYAEMFRATARFGVDPRLVTAVAFVESGFDEEVIRCADGQTGARGIMKLTSEKAGALGVDPCLPEAVILAVAGSLASAFEALDDWELALASYKSSPEEVAAAGGVPSSVQAWVTQVMDKWGEYIEGAPALGPSPVPGSTPGGPKGSTERYTERGLPDVTQRMLDEIIPIFGQGYDVYCFGQRSGPSDHPSGHGCDFIMVPRLNTMPTQEYLDHGWALCNYLIANADRLRVKYIIWQNQIWQNGKWGPYTRVYDDPNLTNLHYDHVHLSLYRS
jgi:hypothetical protein